MPTKSKKQPARNRKSSSRGGKSTKSRQFFSEIGRKSGKAASKSERAAGERSTKSKRRGVSKKSAPKTPARELLAEVEKVGRQLGKRVIKRGL